MHLLSTIIRDDSQVHLKPTQSFSHVENSGQISPAETWHSSIISQHSSASVASYLENKIGLKLIRQKMRFFQI